MPNPLNIGTRDIPLKLAAGISARVKAEWESGAMLDKVSSITGDLLSFWFGQAHCETRNVNFHEGQQQAILNAIYLHEVLKIESVYDIYNSIEPELLAQLDAGELRKAKYDIPKYAIKMATGTGKTLVMHALVLWQYLNAKREEKQSGRFSKHFLLVAPGLIVYERLLDAYLGKEDEGGGRRFETSDLYLFRELFLPEAYRDEAFGFVQGSVAKKDEIGSKITGDGLIAITNWHIFMDKEKEVQESVTPLDDPSGVVKNIFPIRPGISGGNTLDSLDQQFLSGRELDFLASLPDLMVVNDEAHHIHENRSYGEVKEVEWQRGLDRMAGNKGKRFMQIDFSATPYDVTGSGQNRVKHYFPHTVVDFDLKTAIRLGLVKTIALDKRKELTDTTLEYRSIRDDNDVVIGLSEGQKIMLRAGLEKLRILEKHFVQFTADKAGISNKHPKMLVVCEDTNVSPFVEEFLVTSEGMGKDDVVRIDSRGKEELSEVEWLKVKQKLFNVDKHEKPKIVISVLMLREGFDVNNICVIVPLRTASAPILLEQTIGRGLRLMWREPEFHELKQENRHLLLTERREPNNYLDILSIIEHPEFIKFYEELLKEGLIGEIEEGPKDGGGVLGDIIKVGLKSDYQKYDLFWPIIVKDREEELNSSTIDINSLAPFTLFRLEDLKRFVGSGEKFIAEEITVGTRFGEYTVDASLFRAQSYNEYLQKILDAVVNRSVKVTARSSKQFPALQVNNVAVVQTIDLYIRTRIFGEAFDLFFENNWKVLLMKNGAVTQHIVEQVGKAIYEIQKQVDVTEAIVEKRHFSEVPELRMRENFSLPIRKTIYERLPYPSHAGGFERDFIMFANDEGKVESIMKVNEYYHRFARVPYLRADGLLSAYSPDFLVKTDEKMYIIETKADADLDDKNVKQKQRAIVDWVDRVNQLLPENRMERVWEYILLGENHFYGLQKNNASISEICELSKITKANARGVLF
ncbi:MAG: DEAD/DEAH box helicase family protein [bacterium]|nr:DEAD/DEAH box helicase family protein [bacterium]